MGIKFSTLQNIQVSLLNEFLLGFSEITWSQVKNTVLFQQTTDTSFSTADRLRLLWHGFKYSTTDDVNHDGVCSKGKLSESKIWKGITLQTKIYKQVYVDIW